MNSRGEGLKSGKFAPRRQVLLRFSIREAGLSQTMATSVTDLFNFG